MVCLLQCGTCVSLRISVYDPEDRADFWGSRDVHSSWRPARSEHLCQVKSEVGRAGQPVALDLEEVDLVDIDGVRFLNECEAAGIPVLQCSPYVREWMQRARNQPKA